jgi:hypothetical protein
VREPEVDLAVVDLDVVLERVDDPAKASGGLVGHAVVHVHETDVDLVRVHLENAQS